MSTPIPIFYSFRRCPYAMRARLALHFAQCTVELREILLKHKPQVMLEVSPKGTVPVLVLDSGEVLEESLDIMLWALAQHDPHAMLRHGDSALAWVQRNDEEFKFHLDRYKYFERYPAGTQQQYRIQAEVFLIDLEAVLQQQTYLGGNTPDLADLALWPFIRQFAGVDPSWFWQSEYVQVRAWLQVFLEAQAFVEIMPKWKPWQAADEAVLFP
ncbi:MAG: glutathione S-transferase [Gammaproteobacteria bacterium]|jgi:glutathione S-transferase|nr:glutathione S-transferase [Gammaproteobacteria bacterium]MCP4881817.1 glutathione S-transferase [Gammaproteobacteria bacterium]MDP6165567.1 glutathione S-transferase [Gammaproteobacteria bacterium]